MTIFAGQARDESECDGDGVEQELFGSEQDLFGGLREWQKEAFTEYFRQPRRDFLLVATPGAGKTAWALTVAARLLARREIASITVVTPTEHLKYQWAQAADAFGISLDPDYRNAQGRASADFTGVAVTYAQVAAHPALHKGRTLNRRTLVVFDEIHHAGDALSWGEAVREAFEPAKRRLALTGTPFRSDANPIPFVTYVPDADGGRRSASDYVYGYGPAPARQGVPALGRAGQPGPAGQPERAGQPGRAGSPGQWRAGRPTALVVPGSRPPARRSPPCVRS